MFKSKTDILLRVFLLIFCSAIFSGNLFAQQRTSKAPEKIYILDKAEATERWNEYFNSVPISDYCFKGTLEHLPRKGESIVYDVIMWGTHIKDSFAIRVNIKKRSSQDEARNFLLINRQGKSEIFISKNNEIKKLNEDDWNKPLLDGLIYTPFDLLMPYRYWAWEYAGAARVGRILHFYDLYVPENLAAKFPNLKKVRIGLSKEFNAPFQTEYFDAQNKVSRTLSLSSVKKVQGNWLTKQIEMLDENTRDKDKITITDALFIDALDKSVFDHNNLNKLVDTPQLEKI